MDSRLHSPVRRLKGFNLLAGSERKRPVPLSATTGHPSNA